MAISINGSFTPADPMGLYRDRGNPLGASTVRSAYSPLEGNPDNDYDTPLTASERKAFEAWKAKHAPDDTGEDYDLAGAFKAGLTPDPKTGHFSDAFKKPNHPTFSRESRYAKFAPDWAGDWDEAGNYRPSEARTRAEAEAQAQAQSAAAESAFNQLEAERPGRYRLIPASQFDEWQAQWDAQNRSKGLFEDTIKLLDAGTAGLEQSINELVGMVPVVGKPLQDLADAFDRWAYGSNSYSERLSEVIERDIATLTPEMQQARGEQWWNAETNSLGSAWLNPRSYYAGVVESLPSTVATMAPAMWLARGAFLGAVAKGATEKVAAAAAAKTALLTGAITEGGLGGAQASMAVRESIARMPREKILETDAAQAMIAQGMTPDQALEALTSDASTQAFLIGGVATGLFGGFGDRFLAKLIAEGVGGGLARRIVEGAVRGVVAEGLLEEMPQEALSQLGQNIALKNTVAPEQDLLEGVPNAALGGAAIGGAMGGALGGAGGGLRPAGDVAPATLPVPPVRPVPPRKPAGPLATAVEHGIAAGVAPADPIIAADVAAPPAPDVAGAVVATPDPSVPLSPVSADQLPREGANVVVEAEGLPRFTGRVQGYEQTETGAIEALVVDPATGELLQVPIETLLTAKLTDEMVATLDARDNPPIERAPVELEMGSSRQIGDLQVQFPDDAHAQLYDFGRELKIAKGLARTAGDDALRARDIDPAGRTRIADQLGVLPDRVNEIADDYRYRVDRAARAGTGPGLPLNMHGLHPDKLKIWRQERRIADLEGKRGEADKLSDKSPAIDTLDIDAPAHEAATSPLNDLPEPTQAQKEAGNYKLGHFVTGGLDISIENPAGSERKGIDKRGKAWSVTMKSHYGYIKGTVGRDKDHVDVFVKQGTGELSDDAPVFVVDQNNAEGTFDEHKVMLGYSTKGQASNAYRANYTKGWKGLGAITQTTLGEFKQWLTDGNTAKPFSTTEVKAPEPTTADLMAANTFPDDLDEAPETLRRAREAMTSPVNDAPLAPDPENTLLLMACGMAKIQTDQPVPLLDLYNGPLWQDLRAKRGGLPERNMFVLSGKYGFASVSVHGRPYEEKISAEKVDRLIENGIDEPYQWLKPKERKGAPRGSIRSAVVRENRPFKQVIIAGSGEYRRAFDAIVGEFIAAGVIEAGAPVVATKGSILAQRKQFNGFLRDLGSPAAATEAASEPKGPMPPKPENVRPPDLTSPWFPEPEATKDVSGLTQYMRPAQAAARLADWKAEALRIGREEDHSKEGIISLFDASGQWSQPFADAGYTVLRFDTKHGDDIFYDSPEWVMEQMRERGVTKIVGLLSACPCTTFAASGARWWEGRHDVDNAEMVRKLFGPKAAQLFDSPVEANTWMVHATELYADLAKPLFHVMENPIGRLARMSGMPKPLMIFNPNNFGDTYTKKTQLWGNFSTDLPLANVEPVEGSKIQSKLRGDNPEDKAARSLTPEGFSYAFFIAQYQRLAKELGYTKLATPRADYAPPPLPEPADADIDEHDLQIRISDKGPWDFNDVYPAPDAKIVAARAKEGRIDIEPNENGDFDVDQVVSIFEEGLQELQIRNLDIAAARKTIDDIRAGRVKLRKPADEEIARLEASIRDDERAIADLAAAHQDVFTKEAVDAMVAEALRRAEQEQRMQDPAVDRPRIPKEEREQQPPQQPAAPWAPRRGETTEAGIKRFLIDEGKRTGNERLLAFRPDGTLLSDSSGSVSGVEFTPELVEALLVPDAGIVGHHNHPSSRPLSPMDVAMLAFPGLSTVHAHGHNGVSSRASLTPLGRRLIALPGTRREVERRIVTTKQDYALLPTSGKRFRDLIARKVVTDEEAQVAWFALIGQVWRDAGLLDYHTDAVVSAAIANDPGVQADVSAATASLRSRYGTPAPAAGNDRRADPVRHARDVAEAPRHTPQTPARDPVAQGDDRDGRTTDRGAAVDPFAKNKLFTADKVEAARARLKSKLGQLNSGIDPEVLIDGMTIAGAYIEAGVRDFADYAKAMVGDFGDSITPYLLSFWEGARNYPGLDTSGMTGHAQSAALHAAMLKPSEASEAVGTIEPKPAKRTKKTGAAADRTLTQDFGVDHIDAYSDEGEQVKEAFMKDAVSYLRAVADILAQQGFAPQQYRRGKDMKAVSKNESGIAGSGDITLTMRHPETGANVYAHVTGTSLRGTVPTTPSGISLMLRVSKRDGDTFAAAGGNQWMQTDLSAADFAAMIVQQVERAPAEKAHEPRELDQPGPSALEGAPAPAVSRPAGSGDAQQGAEGSGGTDLPGDGRARAERVPAGRSVPDGQGAVPVPAQRDRNAGAGAAQPDARGAGRDESGASGDAARVIEAAATGAATPAQNRAADFTITDEDAIGSGGAKTKFRNNVAAIELLRTLDAEARPATRAEQAVLAKWVGWGGLSAAFAREDGTVPKGWESEAARLKALLTEAEFRAAAASTRNAHYTSPEVVKAIWSIIERLGFKGGRVLEPSIGAGNFIGLMPGALRDASQITGVELDGITGGIARHLYPAAKIHAATGFQDFAVPDGYFDVAIGNPPFGSEKLYDRDRRHLNDLSIHNYFFAKSIEALRPGGILAMVVTNYFLDAVNSKGRPLIDQKAELLGAIRLPNNAFLANAGTEVTTDIVVFRRLGHGVSRVTPRDIDWTETAAYTDKEGRSMPLNRYFKAHPEMMLGDFGAYGTMYAGDSPALVSRPGQDLPQELGAAIERLPRDLVSPPSTVVEPEAVIVVTDVADALVGSMFVTEEGALMIRRPDRLGERLAEPVTLTGKALSRVTGMVRIRDAFAALRRAQIDETATDNKIARLRDRLNKVYDAFVAEHGPVNADANKRLFRADPTWPQVAALEDKFDKGLSDTVARRTGEAARAPSAQKAAIFTRRTQQPYRPPSEAKSAKDALAAVLAEYGRIDVDHMVRLYGRPADQIIDELGPLVFRTPSGSYETAEAYLSGNVKTKLAEAREAAARDAQFRRNVAALEDVQPADIEAVDIDVKAGSPWIPARYIVDFMSHVLGNSGSKATYNRYNASWTLEPSRPTPAADAQYATSRAGVGQVIDSALSGKAIAIYDRLADGTSVFNAEETNAAKDKVERVKAEWRRWLWTDDERRATLSRIYNDTFNTDVLRRFDGSHLALPGKVGDDIIALRPHQKAFIWRGMQTATVLADHTVGAGKTFAAIALAMEMRRVGLARKPMFVVPNHLVGQWGADFVKLYPGAKVLATTKADFEAANRKKLFARVATGDWDAVIVAHSSFGKVPVDPKFEQQFIEQQMRDLDQSASELRRAEGGKSRTVKQIEKAQANLQAKLQKLLDAGGKDIGMTFEEMGVDALFVDEAHEFKNLGFATRMTRVGGLGNTQGSQKAADLYIKSRSVLERTGGRNLVFLSGTPISNTMAELYTVQRYLDYGALTAMGVAHFDAWANVFGEVVTDWELSPSGTYKLNSRFAKFVNMPELMQRYLAFADVITNDDIRRQLAAQGKTLPLPKVKGGKPTIVVVPRSKDQALYIGEPSGKDPAGNDQYPRGSLVYRAENLPKKVEKGSDNMLKVMSDARKAALDMRLIDPSYRDAPGSKVHIAADNIVRLYRQWHDKRGTQLVFIDLSTPKGAAAREEARIRDLMTKAEAGDETAQEALDNVSPDELLALGSSFSVYDDLKAKLIGRGIPEAEIAFIHDAVTELQKEELFGKVRSGRVRVLLGSTPKMGAGTNVQNRLVALHHLDAPWRPSDLEQRDGRGIRQGNELYAEDPEGFEIEILRYATKNTLDARQWQTIEGKARFVAQLRKGDVKERVVEDIAGEAANAAEMKAAASGNPLILEEMDLRQKLRRLEGQSSEHDREQFRIRDAIRRMREEVRQIREQMARHEADAKAAAEALESGLPTTIDGTEVERPGQLGAAVIAAGRRLLEAEATEGVDLGKLGTFKLHLAPGRRVRAEASFHVTIAGTFDHDIFIDDVTKAHDVGTGTAIMNVLRALTREPQFRRFRTEQLERDLPALEAQIRPWPNAEAMAATRARHAEVLQQLKPKQQPPAAPVVAPPSAEASIADAPVITLTGKEIGDRKDLHGMRRNALRWYSDNLVGEAAKTAEGLTVLFNRAGAKASIAASNPTLLQAIPAIRAIIEKGRVLRREKPTRPTKVDTSRETIGGRLVAIREARGAAQIAWAAELGISAQRYNTYERGRSLPPPEVLDRLFELTGATADFVLFGRGRGLPADLIEAMNTDHRPDVRERIVIAAPVQIGDQIITLTVTMHATDDGRFAYDLMPVSAPGRADASAEAGGDVINMIEVPGWGAVDGGATAPGLTDPDRAELERIVREVSGLTETRFHERIALPNGAAGWGKSAPTTAAGYYDPVADVVALAEDSATKRTAYHEAFHRLQRLFLTDDERATLKADLPRLKRMIRASEFRRDQVDGMSAKEIEAEAFAIYATGGGAVPPHKAIRAAWDRILEVVRRVRNFLTGRGFLTSEDVFDAALRGDTARRVAAVSDGGRTEFSIADAPRSVSEARTRVVEELRGKLTDLEPALLAAVPLTYFPELAQPSMSAVDSYLKTKREMDAYRGRKHGDADALAQQWLKYTRLGFGLVPSKEGKAKAAELAELMHDATLAGIDPASTDEEHTLKAGYERLRRRFEAMPPVGRRLYVEVRDAYVMQQLELDKLIIDAVRKAQAIAARRADERYQAEMDRIAKSKLDGEDRRKAEEDASTSYAREKIRSTYANKARLTSLRKSFEANRVQAPYFPLARFGRYFVTVRDIDGTVLSFSRRESATDRNRLAKQMREDFPGRTVETGVMNEAGAGLRDAMDPRLVAEIEGILSGAGVDGTVMDQIWQRYLESMPDLSTRKRYIHRKGTAGFDADALRAFSSHMFHAAHQMGRLKYGVDLQELLDETAVQAREAKDPTKAMTLANELARRHKFIMNPTGGSLAQWITSAMFVWSLAVSPAAALVNLAQTPMMFLPILGARFGMAKATSAVLAATRDFASGRGAIVNSSALTDEERRAIEMFYESGLIDRTQSHDLAGIGDTGVNYSPLRARVMGIFSWAFHRAEVANREISAIAAFRVARAAGQSFVGAVDTAHDLVWKGHYDYSNASRPRFMQNDVAKVAFVFQNYLVNTLYRVFRDIHQSAKGETPQLRKEARVQLAGIMGMMVLMSGVSGFFGFNLLVALAGLFFDDEDDPFAFKEEMKRHVVDLFGADLGGMIWKGVPGQLLDIDLTSRLGMPDFFIRVPDASFTDGRDYGTQLLVGVFGATGSNFLNLVDGVSFAMQGNLVRGVEIAAPKFIKDTMQAWRYLNEGVLTRRGDVTLDRSAIGPWDILSELIGFTPLQVSETYERAGALKDAEQAVYDRRAVLLNQFAMAYAMGDQAAIAVIRNRIVAFNRVPAHRAVVITAKTLRQSLAARQRNADKRLDGVLIQNEQLGHDLRSRLPARVY